jgi:predicted hydrocarbon binding protein
VPEASHLYYPNRIARFFLLAMEDLMGQQGLGTVLHLAELDRYVEPPPDTLDRAFDFADMAALNQALEQMYGARGGQGMALRIGRAAVANGLRHFGALAGIKDLAFQHLPLEERLQLGMTALADIFTHFSDQRTYVENDPDSYRLIVENSPIAWSRSAERPVCSALSGMIEECAAWASNGHEYSVQETLCRAAGDNTCLFVLSKNPVR